ncbi:MAG: amidohydrolase family protein [Deltaproteobacteria bacterium]
MGGARLSDSGRTSPGRRRLALRLLGFSLLGLAVAALFAAGGGGSSSRPTAPPQAAASPETPRATRIPMLDMHVHLGPEAVPRLTTLMHRHGIERVVNLSGGDPLTGLATQLQAAATDPGKIIVFTTLAYGQAEYRDYGRRMARLLEIAHEQGARGLKIAKVLGLGLRDSGGALIRVDDPALDPVFERAGELGMPVAIHTGDPEAFWLPVDARNPRRAELEAHPGWALFGRTVPSFDELLQQLEARIARHPRTTFISVHFGNAAERPSYVAQLLRKYPNLYIDTAARIPEIGRHPPAQLRAFFVEFQDRILYGSDLGVGPEPSPLFLGSQGPRPPTATEQERFFSATRRFFETADERFEHPTPIQGDWKISGIALPRRVLEKVYHDNAARLLGLPALH